MKVRIEKFCAKCREFSTKDIPDEAAAGRGKCTMFENIVHWNGKGCPLFAPAKDMSVRQVWIMKQIEKQPKEESTCGN